MTGVETKEIAPKFQPHLREVASCNLDTEKRKCMNSGTQDFEELKH